MKNVKRLKRPLLLVKYIFISYFCFSNPKMLYLRGFVSVQVNVHYWWKVLGPYLLVCYCVHDLHAFL